MFTRMFVMILIALGIFAQDTKTVNDSTQEYFCMSGIPIFRNELDNTPSEQKYQVARKDCHAQYEQRQAEERKFFARMAKEMEEQKQFLARYDREYEESRQKICRLQTTFKEDGSEEWCKGIAPDLKVLTNAHKACEDYPDLLICKRLKPLSMGKKYPPETKP